MGSLTHGYRNPDNQTDRRGYSPSLSSDADRGHAMNGRLHAVDALWARQCAERRAEADLAMLKLGNRCVLATVVALSILSLLKI